MKKPLITSDKWKAKASDICNRVTSFMELGRRAYVQLGIAIHDFDMIEAWRMNGAESKEEFLGDPAIDIKRDLYYKLKAIGKLAKAIGSTAIDGIRQGRIERILPVVTWKGDRVENEDEIL